MPRRIIEKPGLAEQKTWKKLEVEANLANPLFEQRFVEIDRYRKTVVDQCLDAYVVSELQIGQHWRNACDARQDRCRDSEHQWLCRGTPIF
jgi:hypothetical protein